MKEAKDLKKKFKEGNGITLIALVITIIVLLILAGVSITMLTGDNSILNRASEAKEKTEIAQIKEEAERVKNDYFMNKYLGASNLSTDNSDNKSVQRYAITNLINRHFEGSTKSGNRVTTADQKYDILVRNNLDIVVVKHGERFLQVGDLEITYYVPEDDKVKKTIELYFELGDVPNKNAPTEPTMGEVPGVTISYEEYLENVASKKYENMSTEDLEELVAKNVLKTDKTFDKWLEDNEMTRDDLIEIAKLRFNKDMEYDECLKYALVLSNTYIEYEYYAYLAGVEGKSQSQLEELFLELSGYEFNSYLANNMGITDEESMNRVIEDNGLGNKENATKLLIGRVYKQKIEDTRREIEEKYYEDRAEYERLLAEYQQQFGDIELICPDGSVKLVSQADMYAEYVVTENGTYTFTATGPNGEEGTVTIEINDIAEFAPENITIYEGETATLSLTQQVTGLIWTSSNTSVTIVENGVVTGIKAGTAIITAKTSDGTQISKSCRVTVNGIRNLDGAAVLLDTTVGNDIINIARENISTNNKNIATVTSEGIVKCGTETGTTMVTVNGIRYEITSTAKIVYTASSTGAIKGSVAYNNPVIPEGYSAIDTEDAKWDLTATMQPDVNKGLVIMDNEGNQFVWIPVQTPVSDTEANGNNNKAMAVNVGTVENPEYRGLLYEFTNTNGTLSSKIISGCTTDSNYREPRIIGYDQETNLNKRGLTRSQFSEDMQNDYNNLIQSAIDYGGFYIGRYESSLINEKTKSVSNSHSMTTATSSAKDWYGLYQKQKNYSTTSKGETITIGNMLYGSQYDAMMNWMINNGVDVTSTIPIAGATRNTTRKTGSEVKDKLKNIFDIIGNSQEATQEPSYNSERVLRGCYSQYVIWSPSDRAHLTGFPWEGYGNPGSRLALYVK